MECRCFSKKVAKVLFGISLSILILTTGLTLSVKRIYDTLLKECITLKDGNFVTKMWEDIPLPIYEKLYFFNITNADSFLDGSEPLNVTEVGPYTYVSRWVKHKPQWNSNHTVSYRETRTYYFVPDMSIGSEDDMIYTLNGPMIIGANIISASLRIFFDYYCVLLGENVVIKKSIRDLVYQGYDDDIIKQALILKPGLPYKEGKFSWLYGMNASNDGLFTVFTGTDDERKTDFINNWNGEEKLSFWNGDSCNMINGTSIETGPPIKGHQDTYTFFQSFFCRSITFNYVEDTEHYDMTAKRFRPTYNLFANSTENPDNDCFEVKKERPSGVLDISPCQFGAPVLVSFPHFYLADPSYLDSVNGLNPRGDKHGSYMDVEPITGVSIDLTVKFQINLEIQKLQDFYFFDDVTEGVFPVFWAELSLKIDEELATRMKRYVRDLKIIVYSVLGALQLLGWTGVMISLLVLSSWKTEVNDGLMTPSQSNFCGFTKNSEIISEGKAKGINTDESSTTDFPNEYSEVLKKTLDESTVVDEPPEHK